MMVSLKTRILVQFWGDVKLMRDPIGLLLIMLRALWRQFNSVKVLNGVLYCSFYNTNGDVLHEQLVLPRELRIHFLELCIMILLDTLREPNASRMSSEGHSGSDGGLT